MNHTPCFAEPFLRICSCLQLRYLLYLLLFTYTLLVEYENVARVNTTDIIVIVLVAEFACQEFVQVSYVVKA